MIIWSKQQTYGLYSKEAMDEMDISCFTFIIYSIFSMNYAIVGRFSSEFDTHFKQYSVEEMQTLLQQC